MSPSPRVEGRRALETVRVPPPGAGHCALHFGRTPVTNGDYAPFLAARGAAGPPWWNDAAFMALDQPVVGVTWNEALDFAIWLSAATGAAWRLPAAAEWEWAARGGLQDAATPWGESLPEGEVPSGPLTAPWCVARGTPNGYGLMDIGTIVHEWCSDVIADPRSPEGERRVSCGGSWRHHVRWSPPGARSSLPPNYRYADYGFRVLREV